MRQVWWIALGCALALAACERTTDPTANNRVRCIDENQSAEVREAACTAWIESGDLGAAGAQALANRGDVRREAGQVTAALRDFEAALRADAEEPLALEGRAQILLASGQLDAAELLVDRLIAGGHRLAQAYLMRGDVFLARGAYTEAIASYGEALQHNSRLALAYAHRGEAREHLGEHNDALTDYDAAIRIDGTLAEARAGRCWISLQRNEDLGRARTDAAAATASDPANTDGQTCRGILQLRDGEWAAARESFELVLLVEPGNPVALFGRGIARRRSGDNDGTQDMNQARDFDRHIGQRFDDLGIETF